jgi:hypothetical protein
MKPLLYFLWSIVILAGGLEFGLFLMQGGFGAGHGRFDRALVWLSFPWSLIPWPEIVIKSDFIWLVLIPISINVIFVLALTIAVRRHQLVP